MSWSAPNQSHVQWNPMTMQDNINSGSYTPEQWALMQQQNWQQWTQWQQQYSQWQNQYGDKYAQQLQAVQNIGGIPPPPPAGAAPPLPPDKPPPPPPHENNQPLFNKDKPTPTHNPSQQRNNSTYNTNTGTGNNQWSYSSDKHQQPAVNSEDLKKLTEEERLFDIQFQKWEEEIDKWRQENVNHPDKQAYKDYEAKFEACRKQLLERRQQMKMKRANLLNNSAQANSTGNTSIVPPTPTNSNINIQNSQTQNSQNNSYERNYDQSNKRSINKNIEPQDRYESYHQNVSEKNTYSSHENHALQSNKLDTSFLPPSSSTKGIPGLDLVPDSHPSKKQDVIDISDDLDESQQRKAPDYSNITKGINSILGDEKIMNILSMVRSLKPGLEVETTQNTVNTDNQQFPPNYQGSRNQNFSQPPQYGDRQNSIPSRPGQFSQQKQDINSQFQPPNHGGNHNRSNLAQNQYNDQNNQYGAPNSGGPGMGGGPRGPGGSNGPRGTGPGGPYGTGMHQGGSGMRPSGPGMRPNGPGMRPSGPGMHQGGPGGMRPSGPGMHQGGPNVRSSGPGMHQGGPNVRPSGPGMHQGGHNMRPRGPGMQQGSDMRQSGSNMHQGGPNMQQGGPNMQHGGPNMQQGGKNMQQSGPNMQKSGPNMQQPQPLMANRISMPLHLNKAPERSPLEDSASQQNADYYGAQRPIPAPQQPKWVEDPLFTPSIIVEYEHKSLRLKARDFIEPVHTFDYNHISKDDEFKKKDFEHEADELFTRKPRRSERDFAEDRFRDQGNRDLYQRDYERRGTRDDFRDMPKDIREIRGEVRVREPRDFRDMRGEPRDFRDIREPRDARREEPKREERGFRDTDRVRDDINPRERLREDSRDDFERRRDDRHDDRRRDDRDRYGNKRIVNNDYRDRDSRDRKDGRRDDSRDMRRDDNRDMRRDDNRIRGSSREQDTRKRGLSRESEVSNNSKKSKEAKELSHSNHIVMIDDLLEPPGRSMRPEKIVIILRGLPGSGKSYLAKLIRDREAENGGTARIMSIDDYFMQEGEIEETDPATGKTVKKPSLKYEYDASSEETYNNSLKRAFKRSLTDGYFSFLIYDAVNVSLQSYADIWNYSRQNGFQVYICVMENDIQTCFKRNIHKRSLDDIEVMATRFFPTPAHHIQLDATTLLQSAAITDVHMEDVNEVIGDETQEEEVESVFTSKWEKMDDANKLARLDGTSRPLRPSQLSMEEYLQLDEWTPNVAKPGKKTVRWADLEERREQEKMRAIGFVVGQTDWNRMTDPTMGSSALTQTKYIERTKRN